MAAQNSAPNLREEVTVLLGMLVFLILVNAVATWILREHSTNLAYQIIRSKWHLLLELQQPVDWLILGDSSCNQGVVPAVLEEQLGGRALNLCTIADLLVLNDAWMLEVYIRRFGPPPHVVLVHTYDMWYRNLQQTAMAQLPLPWGFWERLQPSLALSAQEQLRLWWVRYIPLYAEHRTLARLVRSPRALLTQPLHLQEDGLMVVTSPNPDRVEREEAQQLEFVRTHRFQLSATNLQAIHHIVHLAQTHGIQVFIANAPIYQDLSAHAAFQDYFAQVDAMLRTVDQSSERVTYLAKPPLAFSKDEMDYADHVVGRAAETYTRDLASELRAAGAQELRHGLDAARTPVTTSEAP